jgi:hypothetical protein
VCVCVWEAHDTIIIHAATQQTRNGAVTSVEKLIWDDDIRRRTPQRTPSSSQLHQHAQRQRFTTANHDSLCPMLPRPVVSRETAHPAIAVFVHAHWLEHPRRRTPQKGPSTSIASIQPTRRRCRRPRRLRVRPAHSVPANTHNRWPTVCKPRAAAFQKAMLLFSKSKFKGAC